MTHDSERNAGAYVGGLLKGARRRRFERHLLACEDCWREVELGRQGRAVAEAGRELAPVALREHVRASVEAVRPRPRRPAWLLGIGIATVGAIVVVYLLIPREPAAIEAALTAFSARNEGVAAEPVLPARLGALTLTDSRSRRTAELSVISHRYEDSSGDTVVVFVADEEWPVAVGAEHDNAGETWTARKNGLVLMCLNEPKPSLVVGDDAHDVEIAAYALRP